MKEQYEKNKKAVDRGVEVPQNGSRLSAEVKAGIDEEEKKRSLTREKYLQYRFPKVYQCSSRMVASYPKKRGGGGGGVGGGGNCAP